MTSAYALYQSSRVAAGYAFARPDVHRHIVRRARDTRLLPTQIDRALDIGCGAGRSTAALRELAQRVIGIDPAPAMLEHRRIVAPHARFVVGEAERLPFPDGTFDLITAAGSINYVDRALALPEISRVLGASGTFLIYDFSAGRRLADSPLLETWYTEFERRYPDAPRYEMDVRALPFRESGLVLSGVEAFDVAIAMTLDSYLRYVLSETRVELARTQGADEAGIREWCRLTLETILDDRPRDVIFPAYAAVAKNRSRGAGELGNWASLA